MRVLVGCEHSGIVRDEFAKRGHDAWSCDLLPSDRPGNHIQGDVFKAIEKHGPWDIGIFHPPCTYLTNSGVRWLFEDFSRWADMAKGALFFRKLLDADIERLSLENPIMHKHAMAIVNCPPTQIIQPWMFGHTESKATCLWLKNLPSLVATNDVYREMMLLPAKERNRIHYASPGPDRWKERSKTFQGIAEAMADQWGGTGETVKQRLLFEMTI